MSDLKMCMLSTEFLDTEDDAIVRGMMNKSGLDPEAWIRFWDKGTIQLDGDFRLADLKLLVAMMESLMPVSEA